MTVLTTPLQFPTADNTHITIDSVDFTADGANLINGGGTDIREAPPAGNFNKLSYTVSALIPF